MVDGVAAGTSQSVVLRNPFVAQILAPKFLDIRIAMGITPVNAIFCEATADSKALSESKVA